MTPYGGNRDKRRTADTDINATNQQCHGARLTEGAIHIADNERRDPARIDKRFGGHLSINLDRSDIGGELSMTNARPTISGLNRL